MEMGYLRTSISCVFLITCFSWLSGQSSVQKTAEVNNRFVNPATIQWLKTFAGTWQGLHPIEIVLGYNGEEYHGILTFTSEDDLRFDLYGEKRGEQIRLHEIDATGRHSGVLELDLNNDKLRGKWWSVDFSRAASLVLQSESVVKLRHFTPGAVVLHGNFGGDAVALVIQREEPDLLSGFCALNEVDYYRIEGTCKDAVCDKMELWADTPDGTVFNTLLSRYRGTEFTIFSPDDDGIRGILTMDRQINFNTEHEANYIGTVDCIYPMLGHPGFDQWISSLMESWTSSMSNAMADELVEIGTPGPRERWKVRASAWTDLTLVTPEVASGLITMYEGNSKSYTRKEFIYDLRSDKLINVDALSRKGYFNSTLLQDAKNQYVSDASGGREFKYITLSPSGFAVFTDFNHIDGDAWTLLPYPQYDQSMKRNTLITDLVRE